MWRWDPIEGDESFWAYLALIRLGHSPTKPFFKHVFPKLKTLGRLRGIKKDVFFDKLPLPHLERLKPHLNSDELLSMVIHVSMFHCLPVACTDLGTVRGTRVGVRPPKPGRRQHSRSGPDWPEGGRTQSRRQHGVHPEHERGAYRPHTAPSSERDRRGRGSSRPRRTGVGGAGRRSKEEEVGARPQRAALKETTSRGRGQGGRCRAGGQAGRG